MSVSGKQDTEGKKRVGKGPPEDLKKKIEESKMRVARKGQK